MTTKMHYLLVAIAATAAVQGHAATFVVEEDALGPIPQSAVAAISRTQGGIPTDYQGQACEFTGKAVALSAESSESIDWIATTKNACAWAASAAPIWVIRRDKIGYKVLLFHVTYDLTLGTGSQNGLRHIATARATAARVETQLWKFDGQTYKLVRARVQELSR